MEIKELMQIIHKNNSEKGFWADKENPNIPLRLVLIHAEVSEALEAHRDSKRADIQAFKCRELEIKMSYPNKLEFQNEDFIPLFKSRIKDTFEDELADIIIRTLDLAKALNIDLEQHIIEKIKFNTTRPFKHDKPY